MCVCVYVCVVCVCVVCVCVVCVCVVCVCVVCVCVCGENEQRCIIIPTQCIAVALFPGLPRSFCSSVCVDNNTTDAEEPRYPSASVNAN